MKLAELTNQIETFTQTPLVVPRLHDLARDKLDRESIVFTKFATRGVENKIESRSKRATENVTLSVVGLCDERPGKGNDKVFCSDVDRQNGPNDNSSVYGNLRLETWTDYLNSFNATPPFQKGCKSLLGIQEERHAETYKRLQYQPLAVPINSRFETNTSDPRGMVLDTVPVSEQDAAILFFWRDKCEDLRNYRFNARKTLLIDALWRRDTGDYAFAPKNGSNCRSGDATEENHAGTSVTPQKKPVRSNRCADADKITHIALRNWPRRAHPLLTVTRCPLGGCNKETLEEGANNRPVTDLVALSIDAESATPAISLNILREVDTLVSSARQKGSTPKFKTDRPITEACESEGGLNQYQCLTGDTQSLQSEYRLIPPLSAGMRFVSLSQGQGDVEPSKCRTMMQLAPNFLTRATQIIDLDGNGNQGFAMLMPGVYPAKEQGNNLCVADTKRMGWQLLLIDPTGTSDLAQKHAGKDCSAAQLDQCGPVVRHFMCSVPQGFRPDQGALDPLVLSSVISRTGTDAGDGIIVLRREDANKRGMDGSKTLQFVSILPTEAGWEGATMNTAEGAHDCIHYEEIAHGASTWNAKKVYHRNES